MLPDLRINPGLTALEYEGVLAVFAGDRTLTWKGKDAALVFQILKSLRDGDAGAMLEQDRFRRLVPDLLDQGVLIRVAPAPSIRLCGRGGVTDALGELIAADSAERGEAGVLVACLPDEYSLTAQEAALRSLGRGEALLTGFRRGSTFFVLPLIAAGKCDLADLAARLLGSEPGIGNLFLGYHLLHSRQAYESPPLAAPAARWIAHDLWSLITSNRLDFETARVYRGEAILREDFKLTVDRLTPLPAEPEDRAESLRRSICGYGRPITSLSEVQPAVAVPHFHAATALICRPSFTVLTTEEQLTAWGTGPTQARATLAAAMEGVERYSASCFRRQEHPLRRADELDGPALPTDAVTCFGEGDAVWYARHGPSDVRRWQAVTSLRTGLPAYLPVELIYYPLDAEHLGYQPCDETNSSGTAAHFSRDGAVDRGLAEIVEREAFLIAWLRKAAPPRIALGSLPDPLAEKVAALARAGVQTWLLNLTADLCPVVAALMRRPGAGGCRLGIGAAAQADPVATCLKALDEAALGVLTAGPLARSAAEAMERLATPSDHLAVYASGAYDDLLLGLFESGVETTIRDLVPFRGGLVQSMLDRGHEIYVADVTAPLVREGLPDCHVVRVIAPGFLPMRFGKQWVRTGGERIWQIPEAKGWRPNARRPDELQRFPHPFA